MPIALYYQGNCFFALGDYTQAAQAYARLVKSPGNDLLPPDDKVAVLHNLAISYYHSNQMETGRHWFGVLLRTSQEQEDKSLAAAALLESYVKAGMFDQVRPLIINIDPNSKYWSETRLNLQLWRTAEHFAREGDAAAEEFYRNLVIFPGEEMEKLAIAEANGGNRPLVALPPPSRYQSRVIPLPKLKQPAKRQIAKGDLPSALPAILKARSRLGTGQEKERANLTYMSGLAHLRSYQEKQDLGVLGKAISEFEKYIQDYPDGSHVHYALANLAECWGLSGNYAASIQHMQDLLDPGKPYANRLDPEEYLRCVRYIVNISRGKEDWPVCQPWGEKLLSLSKTQYRKTQAASILAEAYLASGMYTEATALIPLFEEIGVYRVDPHLNFLFMKAADTLAEDGEREMAETFYGLAMVPEEISGAISRLLDESLPQARDLQSQKIKDGEDFPEAKEVELLELEAQREVLERQRKRVGLLLSSGDGNYGELLRWRRAHNFAKMGRPQEAFTLLTLLLADFPDAKPENRESYLYQAIVEADKLGKSESVLRMAKTYLKDGQFQSHVYEISVIYTKPLLRKAQELKTQALKLHRTEEGARAWEVCEETYMELWKLCLRLARSHPLEPNARYVVFTAGVSWMDMDQAKFARTGELIRVFQALADKDYGGESPSFLDGIHYWLGMAYTTKGKHSEAFGHFAMARKLNPSGEYYRDALFRLGECAKRMGKADKARSFFKEFMKEYPNNGLVYKAEAYLREIAAAE